METQKKKKTTNKNLTINNVVNLQIYNDPRRL